jgi:hypothetical protein
MIVILTKRNLAKARAVAGGTDEAQNKAMTTKAAALVPDGTRDRLLKLIPGEAAAAYTLACGFSTDSTYLPITAFFLSAFVLVLTIRISGKAFVPPIEPEPLQYVVRMAAFVAWAFAIRNPIGPWFTVPAWIPAIAILFIPVVGAFLIGGADEQ